MNVLNVIQCNKFILILKNMLIVITSGWMGYWIFKTILYFLTLKMSMHLLLMK